MKHPFHARGREIMRLMEENDKLLATCIVLEQERDEARNILKEIREMFYGQGLEVLNWHQNGDTESVDSFFESNPGWLEDTNE